MCTHAYDGGGGDGGGGVFLSPSLIVYTSLLRVVQRLHCLEFFFFFFSGVRKITNLGREYGRFMDLTPFDLLSFEASRGRLVGE